MRILRAVRSVDAAYGGPVEGIVQSSKVLLSWGHQVDIVTLDSPGDACVRDFPLPATCLGPARGIYGYAPAYVPWLRQHAREYDAVLVHGLWQYTGFGAWRALHASGQPYFVFTHGMLDPWFKRAYPFKHLKKLLYWPWAEYRVLRDARAVLFTCEEERVLARQSFSLYNCREAVVNYGTAAPPEEREEEERQAFLDRFLELAGKRVLLFLGRIHPKKGCDLLIEAFARMASRDPSLHLVLAGPGSADWLADLRRLGERLEVARRITWTGMLSGDLKWGAFRSAEVFVLPSHQENFGIAVVEALACGVPVLLSDKVNIWREIEADGAGFVARDDLGGTLELLARWEDAAPESRSAMRARARACFASRFEIHRAARSLIEVLESGSRGKEVGGIP